MSVAAVAVLAATAVVAAALWYVVDRRRERLTVSAAVLAAGVPALLLGAAALLALGDSGASDNVIRTAHAVAVVAAIPGGGLVATAVLRLADRSARLAHTGLEKSPPPGPAAVEVGGRLVPPPPPPPSPVPQTAPWTPWSVLDASGEASTSSGAARSGAAVPATERKAFSNPETLRGGAAIGSLERVAVVVSLLAGWPEGLALTLAIKGFGRYPELRKPSAPERFIVGTFASILWAAAVAGVVVALRA